MISVRNVLSVILWVIPALLAGQGQMIKKSVQVADGDQAPYNSARPGDTIWIESGTRQNLLITDFHGEPGRPVVFANHGGQVLIETDQSYGISFRNCSYFILTGIPDDTYQYGIKVGRVGSESGMGISVGYRSTDFTIKRCEVANTGFAGIMAKTEPVCDDPSTWRSGFTQYNTVIRDCYIHDVLGEGIYVGSSFYLGQTISPCGQTVLPPVLVGAQILYNRIERSGWDGIQVSSAVSDCNIHHNTLKDCSYLMYPQQMSGINIGGGTLAKCYNNTITDCFATGILLFGNGGTEVYNNLILRPGKKYQPDEPDYREHGIFVSDKTQTDKTYYGIYQNTIIQPKSDAIRIDSNVELQVRIYNNVLVDPGAYDVYENDNTSYSGPDAYIFDVGRGHQFKEESNYYSRTYDNAGFSNPGQDNFRLKPGSALIDLGKSLYQNGIRTDLDEKDRPLGFGYDIGAFEYAPGQGIEDNPAVLNGGSVQWSLLPGSMVRIMIKPCSDAELMVEITDMAGRSCFRKKLTGEFGSGISLDIPLSGQGLFILNIRGENVRYAGKILLY
jgi:hypothetical protein